ncbi:hypothetical protein E3U55_11450 [Filobacillus milosensis]|uniref:Lipoprotein n=1 Tax=Filobacillus milosensis TaxID=94137 RepID=A0A4Y8IJ16_9BACI|nr:DUF6376 family protein [Filobacillus milosensis]TFB18880.1 hypothetical protein E3U55_11450 [Filobacillus milosensis]
MRAIIILLIFTLLAGCGLIEEVNNTLDYGKEAKDYVSTMASYQDDVSTFLNKKELTQEDFEELKSMMDEIEAEVKGFNELEPPSVAEGVHNKIEEQNNQILEAIDEANRQIEQGEFDQSAFENLEIVKSLEELKSYREQIENFMNN